MSDRYIAAGLMSGTSLDGLDIAICRFEKKDRWLFEILAAKTFEYTPEWKVKLLHAHQTSGHELALMHTELGSLQGKLTHDFISESKIRPDFIASHGHTIFHQPEKRMTLQIGSAAHMAAETQLPVIADFRMADVALGGQGAPLVPIGDLLLFDEYAICLNLGGIANISVKNHKRSMVAYDVCPCNMVLNDLAKTFNLEYDRDGLIASSGRIDEALLNDLNSLTFYNEHPPKSLGKEFYEMEVKPLLKNHSLSAEDSMRTFVEHIAIQLGRSTEEYKMDKMLITGGGALNKFLIERISAHCKVQIIVPELALIQFKEALIFGLLGVLRMRDEINCLSSVTGASRDSIGGAIYSPF